ncbi:MAG TPA: hypothetical protein VHV49_18780, partial [Pseudonocardiaceae bacterium]|nr:hypothetical protein [Pseudonocardiaceae bacterium]
PPAYAGASAAPVWRRRVLTAVAIIVAALIGILVANTFVDTSGDNSSAAAATTTPDPSVLNAPLPSALPTFSAPPAATVTPTTAKQPNQNGKPQAQQELAVLHAYVGMLPGQAAQAFGLLTPAEQARSGGPNGYLATWNLIRKVELGDTNQRDGAILAKIKLTPKLGRTTDNTYRFTFAQQNGNLLINSITQVGRSRHD